MDNVDKLIDMQNGEQQVEKKSQSQIIVGLTGDMELFYDEQNTSYAKVKINDHYEVWPIDSGGFRNILTYRFLNLSEDKDKAPGKQALQDACRALEAKARIEGKQEKVHVRIAENEDGIYIDLCNSQWQVIKIDKKGWKVIDESPVYFKRSKTMQSLPTPIQGGTIQELKPFINYANEADFKLIIAWILSNFRENSPFPILTIQGEHGSAKSTTTKVLRALIDPSSLPLRALPKEEKDLAIAANNTWVLAFDNLSGLSNQMSDALCKFSTGGGVATRKLYTDDEEAVFNVMRPIILNGIEDIATRQDLLDRSIVLSLPSIPEDNRLDEKTFWNDFKIKHPSILGALCDVVSQALVELPETTLTKKPRMADFATWVTASESALSWQRGEFISIYVSNRNEAIDQGLEADPFASAILELLKVSSVWIGNVTKLLAEAGRYTNERTKKSRVWPNTRTARGRLRRLSPALRHKNILYVEWDNKSKKTLRLEKIEQLSSSSSYRHEVASGKARNDDDNQSTSSSNDDNRLISSSDKSHEYKVRDDDDDNYDKDVMLI